MRKKKKRALVAGAGGFVGGGLFGIFNPFFKRVEIGNLL